MTIRPARLAAKPKLMLNHVNNHFVAPTAKPCKYLVIDKWSSYTERSSTQQAFVVEEIQSTRTTSNQSPQSGH